MNLWRCNPFLDAKTFLLCFEENCFWKKSNFFLNFCQLTSFNAVQVSFEQIFQTFAEKLCELFGTGLQESTFGLARKRLKHLKIKEILCFHHPYTLTVSIFRLCKIFKEWSQYLYSHVVDRLLVVPSYRKKTARKRCSVSIPVN